MEGHIHSIETLAATDGPGIRVAVFLQGCPQRCIYCHNPDTWQKSGGTKYSANEILEKVKRYRPYFKEDGGITISGGEPFLQAEFTKELLKLCKSENINTAVDTCGYYLNDTVKEALAYTDLVLLDIKHTNPDKFKEITKVDYKHTDDFIKYMIETQKPVWIRQVIVPTLTDADEQIYALLDTIKDMNVKRVDLLPYHSLGVSKWDSLGIEYTLKDTNPPNHETMNKLREIVQKQYK